MTQLLMFFHASSPVSGIDICVDLQKKYVPSHRYTSLRSRSSTIFFSEKFLSSGLCTPLSPQSEVIIVQTVRGSRRALAASRLACLCVWNQFDLPRIAHTSRSRYAAARSRQGCGRVRRYGWQQRRRRVGCLLSARVAGVRDKRAQWVVISSTGPSQCTTISVGPPQCLTAMTAAAANGGYRRLPWPILRCPVGLLGVGWCSPASAGLTATTGRSLAGTPGYRPFCRMWRVRAPNRSASGGSAGR